MTDIFTEQSLIDHARALNTLIILQRLTYGSKLDFINDHMESCLQQNIIPKECAESANWKKYDIQIIDHEPIEAHMIPFLPCLSFDSKENEKIEPKKIHWKFDFKKILLPDKWYLRKGCSCGSNLNPTQFMLFDDNNVMMNEFVYFDSLK